MNKKGYTLIELLATLTILSIIMLIAFPSVNWFVKSSDEQIMRNMGKSMVAAAKKYINDEKMAGNGCKQISAKDLIDRKLIGKLEVKGKFSCDEEHSFVLVHFSAKERNFDYYVTCDGGSKEVANKEPITDVKSGCSSDEYVEKSKSVITANKNFNPPDVKDKISVTSNYVPIRYADGKWVKADVKNLKKSPYYWYDYQNGMWANMAIVLDSKRADYYNASPGTEINMNDVTSMWVWIPRFSYNLNELKDKDAKEEVTLKVAFEKTDKTKDGYTVPDAFQYIDGGSVKQLSGFWFSKYNAGLENGTSRTNCTGFSASGSEKLVVKAGYPFANCYGAKSAHTKIKNVFGTSDSINYHLMKNSEYLAMFLLASSKYGGQQEITFDKTYETSYQTGKTKDGATYKDDVNNSSTHNMSGVFDMAFSLTSGSVNGYLYTSSYYGNLWDDFVSRGYETTVTNQVLYFYDESDSKNNQPVLKDRALYENFITELKSKEITDVNKKELIYMVSNWCVVGTGSYYSVPIMDTLYEGVRARNADTRTSTILFYNYITYDTRYYNRKSGMCKGKTDISTLPIMDEIYNYKKYATFRPTLYFK